MQLYNSNLLFIITKNIHKMNNGKNEKDNFMPLRPKIRTPKIWDVIHSLWNIHF